MSADGNTWTEERVERLLDVLGDIRHEAKVTNDLLRRQTRLQVTVTDAISSGPHGDVATTLERVARRIQRERGAA